MKSRVGSLSPMFARTTRPRLASAAARSSTSVFGPTEPPATTANSVSCAAIAASASSRLKVPVAAKPAESSTCRACCIFSGDRPTTIT
jgi:hypothetical protein